MYNFIDWPKIRACTNEEKRDLLPFIKEMFFMAEDCRSRGAESLWDYMEKTKDPFKRKSLDLVTQGYEPNLLTEILYTSIVSTTLPSKKYLEYVIFVRLILIIQEGKLPVAYSKSLIESYLGTEFAGVID